MSDALCGPSNALQNFKSHTSVDRTLQQDRLISRQQPGQGFRSHDPNAGILDPEFEAFQAGQPSAFAANGLSHPLPIHDHFSQNLQHAGPSHSHPSQTPAWAADFQNLNINSPAPLQQQQQQQQQRPMTQNPAWANQFQQTSANTLTHAGYASSGLQYQNGPAYSMNQSFMPGIPRAQFQAPLQQSQSIQAAKDDFDDAAFQAAFDSAMEDAFHAQEQQPESKEAEVAEEAEEGARTDKADIYPEMPLIRLALLKAIMDGTDHSLHEAALFVNHLTHYRLNHIDPFQAMLLRPIIIRLADQSRSNFAQRYHFTALLPVLANKCQEAEKKVPITRETERLLAAYADCLWGRDLSNHLQTTQDDAQDEEYWRISLEESMDNTNDENPTTQALNMLRETNLYGFPAEGGMRRVQDLEFDAYRARHHFPASLTAQSGDPQNQLFHMAQTLSEDSRVHEAIKSLSVNINPEHAVEDYVTQRDLLEQAQKQPSWMETQQELNSLVQQNRERVMMSSAEERQAMLDGINRIQTPQETIRPMEDEQTPQQQQDQPTRADDELAQTAADLLDKISHERSSKFQNSAFLGLMRKLADREVKVEGDKMVEVSTFIGRLCQSFPNPRTDMAFSDLNIDY
ncbi:hypothetical protein BDV97DRAFT_392 [Delphinella strobiligena]|nr:hypothetical protein BDV97DRAFT_392 [Delphinella strobiligena]